jgi:flagellar motility protein MotE (MotC chaperone)
MTSTPKRPVVRYLAAAAFAVNGALFIAAGLLGLPGFAVPGFARDEAREEAKDANGKAPIDADADRSAQDRLLGESMKQLSSELKARDEALQDRERKAADAERRLQSLALRLGVDPNNVAAAKENAPSAGVPAGSKPGEAAPPSEMFKRLLASYENMEPENAASALRRLFALDRNAVVELVSGMSSRKAGGVMDALASTDPAMTADLSHELWRRGRSVPAAGGM